MSFYKYLLNEEDRKQTYEIKDGRYISGHSIGIIAVDLKYPKLPGNVVNATTFEYPVLYKKVEFEIEKLLKGDPEIETIIINAAKDLEKDGVRAVIGACGFFANFQKSVAESIDIPAYLSSLIQIPMIKTGLKTSQKVGVLTASVDNITEDTLRNVGASMDDCILMGIEFEDGFTPIREDLRNMDNTLMCDTVVKAAIEMVNEHPEIGAILLECSDMPPYAHEIQKHLNLPVFDYITLINWVNQAVVKKPYNGYF